MPATRSREFISLEYHPSVPMDEQGLREMFRMVEAFLQRLETRVQALQDQVATLETRLTVLEP